jgi:hypothetical protein
MAKGIVASTEIEPRPFTNDRDSYCWDLTVLLSFLSSCERHLGNNVSYVVIIAAVNSV